MEVGAQEKNRKLNSELKRSGRDPRGQFLKFGMSILVNTN